MKNDFIKKQVQQKQTKKSKVPKWQVYLLLALMVLWTLGSVLGGVAFVKADVPQSYSVYTDKPFDIIPDTNDLYGFEQFSMPNNSNFDKFSDRVILFENSVFENNTTMSFTCNYSTATYGTGGSLGGVGFRNYITGSNYTNTFYLWVRILYDAQEYIFRIYDFVLNKTTNVGTFVYIPNGIVSVSVGSYNIDITFGTANAISNINESYLPYMKTFYYDLSYSNAYKTGYDLGYKEGFHLGAEKIYNSLLNGFFTDSNVGYGLACYSSYAEAMYGNGSFNIPFDLTVSPNGDNIDFTTLYNAMVEYNNNHEVTTHDVDFGQLEINLSYPLYFGGISLESTIYESSAIFRLYSSATKKYYNCTFSLENGSIIPEQELSNIIIDKVIIEFTGDPMSTFFSGSYLKVIGENNEYFYQSFNAGYAKGLEEKAQESYDLGFKAGEDYAKQYWYNQGVESANEYTFFSLIASVVDAPLSVIQEFLNFEILDFNMSSLFFSLMTLSIVLVVVRLVLMKF